MTTAAGLGALGVPGTAHARHPTSDAAGPWVVVSLVVLALAFALVWGVSAYLERRQKPPSRNPESRTGG